MRDNDVDDVATTRRKFFREIRGRDAATASEAAAEIAAKNRRGALDEGRKDGVGGRRETVEASEVEEVRAKEEEIPDAPRGELQRKRGELAESWGRGGDLLDEAEKQDKELGIDVADELNSKAGREVRCREGERARTKQKIGY